MYVLVAVSKGMWTGTVTSYLYCAPYCQTKGTSQNSHHSVSQCTYTHSLLTALCLGQPRWASTNLDFTEARDSEWQWHQLGHMQVCTSLQADNRASTPPLSFLQAGCPSCHPTNSVKALKATVYIYRVEQKFLAGDEKCWLTAAASALSTTCSTKDSQILLQQNRTVLNWECQVTQDLCVGGTRSSAIAEGPRDASCQFKSCQLPRNSAETTYTTSPDQIDGMKLEI